jgi:hypothetical protein
MSRIEELERRVAQLERHLGIGMTGPVPFMPYVVDRPALTGDCNCLPGQACSNAARPRAVRPTAAAAPDYAAFTRGVVG